MTALYRRLPRWLIIPLLAFLLSRAIIFGVGLAANTMLPAATGHWTADPNSPFLSMWAKWDSQFYVDIAANGYWYNPGQQSNVAFFPLYPLLMHVSAPLLGGNQVLAGFLISNLALLGTLIFFYKLTELEFDKASAQRSVFYLALFPTAFFFSAVYTESLFLLLSIACIYYARRQRWVAAALLGMAAAATRNLGVLLWGLVLWEWLRTQGWSLMKIHKKENWKNLSYGLRQHWFDLLIIAIIPLGLLAYMLFLQKNFESPLAFFSTQVAFGRNNIGVLTVIKANLAAIFSDPINKGWMTRLWNMTALLGFLAMVPFIWRRLGEGYALFVLIQLVVPAMSASGSLIRYVLTAFPAFMLLGWWGRREGLDRMILSVSTALLGLLVAIFVNWIFVA